MRFKTLAKTTFYTYLTALAYWLYMIVLTHPGRHQLSEILTHHPSYMFYMCFVLTLTIPIIYQYFRIVKEKLRQNIVMN